MNIYSHYPALKTYDRGKDIVEAVFHIALGDIYSNLRLGSFGLIEKEQPLLFAGLDYHAPWTRDAAINVWNGAGLFLPEISQRTLLSCLERNKQGELVIQGEYWDKMLWTIGAWNLYLYTGDCTFLKDAYQAAVNTLLQLEDNEFSEVFNLFRGPAVYGDGVAAYPDLYSRTGEYTEGKWVSTIGKWVEENPDLTAEEGYGLPMHALSTNCMYYGVYKILPEMEKELGRKVHEEWNIKARNLKRAINRYFWDEEEGTYRYLVDPHGNCDYQEGMGLAYALIFGIADAEQTRQVLENAVVEPAGIPCVYPSFPRYRYAGGYGRHSGVVWSHIQGFWAEAAARYGNENRFTHEFEQLTQHAYRDRQFREIYHPKTGRPYGGLQEFNEGGIREWESTNRQTWGATGYIRIILRGLLGMRFDTEGIRFEPFIPYQFENFRLKHLRYRDAVLNISVKGSGNQIATFTINGQEQQPFLPAGNEGIQNIVIRLK